MNLYDNEYIKFEQDGELYACLIRSDDEAPNPREWGGVGKMVCFHRRYRLGDPHGFKYAEDFLVSFAIKYFGLDEDTAEGLSMDKFLSMLRECDRVVMLPVYLYDHSGITMSTAPFGDRWDSGHVGWIYVDRTMFMRETGNLAPDWRTSAVEMLRDEVNVYRKYLGGDCYGYTLYRWNREECSWDDTEDSCWGFYGSDIEENGIADHIPGLLNALRENRYERGEAEIQHVVLTKYNFA